MNPLKRLIATGLVSLPFRKFFASALRGTVTIFMLHRIADPSRGVKGHSAERLNQFLKILKANGHQFISLSDAIEGIKGKQQLPHKAVVFTLDDGFYDQAEIAAPIFIRHQCPATIFLITGFIDNELWPWDDQIAHILNSTTLQAIALTVNQQTVNLQLKSNTDREIAINQLHALCKSSAESTILQIVNGLSEITQIDISAPPHGYKPMTWSQARELEHSGISFAPHSVSHRIIARMSLDHAEAEITTSWQRLESELTKPLKVFCYPTGRYAQDFGPREIAMVKMAGFHAAVSADPGYTTLVASHSDSDTMYYLPRFSYDDNLIDMQQYAFGVERVKQSLHLI